LPEKVIKKFEIKRLSILDEHGNYDKKLAPKLTSSEIKRIYENMVMARVFDEKALKLQRTGRIGTYASMRGQEATIIGSIMATRKSDWIVPCFRESGAFLAKGIPLSSMYQYWGGDERGMSFQPDVHMLPVAITVGAQPLHAVGIGMAAKIKKDKIAVAVYFGDGATSEGDCLEALNFAGVFKAPVVFINQNNQWAISVPRKKQTAAETLAQKAIAFGFEGVQVDGNDVFAVYKAVKHAMDKARSGKGPMYIECETYRLGDHTTSDDAKKYRREKDVREWEKKDPFDRLIKFMEKNKIGNKKYFEKTLENATEEVEKAVKEYEAKKLSDRLEIFKYMYEKQTPNLVEQMNYLDEVSEK
jgi:pyruvate dehydrogenase E1 component alpha subunit